MKKLMNRMGLLTAAFALALAVALALNAATQNPAVAQTSATTPTPTATPSSDTDGNGLIEISTAAQLNAMRWDLNGDGDQVGDGDPDASVSPADRLTYFSLLRCSQPTTTEAAPPTSTCKGYELTKDISLAEYKNTWQPIGPNWQAVFDGNGFSITDLEGQHGLFRAIGIHNDKTVYDKTIVKNVDVVGAKITLAAAQGGGAGVLAASNHATIIGSYVTGELTRNATVNNGRLGGLVGFNMGTIAASVADVNITLTSIPPGERLRVGGLAGVNYGAIHRSYAYGNLTDARTADTMPPGIFHAQGFAVNHSRGTIDSSLSYGYKIVNGTPLNAAFKSLAKFAYGGTVSDDKSNPSNTSGLTDSCALDHAKFICPTPTPTPTPTN